MISALGSSAYAIEQHLARFERSAARVAGSGASSDYVREAVEQMGAEHAVKANVKVLRTADQMVGALFDIIA